MPFRVCTASGPGPLWKWRTRWTGWITFFLPIVARKFSGKVALQGDRAVSQCGAVCLEGGGRRRAGMSGCFESQHASLFGCSWKRPLLFSFPPLPPAAISHLPLIFLLFPSTVPAADGETHDGVLGPQPCVPAHGPASQEDTCQNVRVAGH